MWSYRRRVSLLAPPAGVWLSRRLGLLGMARQCLTERERQVRGGGPMPRTNPSRARSPSGLVVGRAADPARNATCGDLLGELPVFIALLPKVDFADKVRGPKLIRRRLPNPIDPTASLMAFLLAARCTRSAYSNHRSKPRSSSTAGSAPAGPRGHPRHRPWREEFSQRAARAAGTAPSA